jgi:hypothetical protein
MQPAGAQNLLGRPNDTSKTKEAHFSSRAAACGDMARLIICTLNATRASSPAVRAKAPPRRARYDVET